MMGSSLGKLRAYLIRGLAVVAVVLTYAVSSVGTQVATSIGLTGLTLTTATTPAEAGWWGRRRYYRRHLWFPRLHFYRLRWW